MVVGGSEAVQLLRGQINTFPFNPQVDVAHEHIDTLIHKSIEVPALVLSSESVAPPSGNRQGNTKTDVSFPAVAASSPGADGKRCIDKVEMVEETEYDEVVQCDHSYDRRCHTTYVTNYESQQEEECEENFRKNCFIN